MLNESSQPSGNSLWLKLCGALIMLAFGIGMITLRLPPWAEKMSMDWGPGFIILAGFAAGIVHYVPRSAIADFISAQKEQAIAMTAISLSLREISGQAGKLDEMKEILREIQLDQRVDAERLKRIEEGWLHARP